MAGLIMLILVAIGGAIGAVLRLYILATPILMAATFPFGTILINAVGSFLMGTVIFTLAKYFPAEGMSIAKDTIGHSIYIFLGMGVLGGFTTFSAFSLDIVNLVYADRMFEAFAYALVSVISSVAAIFAAIFLCRAILP